VKEKEVSLSAATDKSEQDEAGAENPEYHEKPNMD